MDKFRAVKAEIYVVGGAVRDLLMGREVKDWDFTTNIKPKEIQKLFPKNSFYDNRFGTVGVVGKNKEIFEVTTFRTERDYSDGRHPDEVRWGESLAEDLKRRDFTINAMAIQNLPPTPTTAGRPPLTKGGEKNNLIIVDLYKGQEDLKKGLIRAVGNPDQRFGEDALRMLRAIRIAAEIGFMIEEKTFESIRKNAKLIKKIAGERIRDELWRILKAETPGDGIKILRNCGLLAEIMPELLEGIGVKQKGHHIYDVWEHSLRSLDNCQSQNPITKLATLVHDVAKPRVLKITGDDRTFHSHEIVGSRMAVAIGKRLRLSNKELDQLFRLVRWHMFTASEILTDSAVRRFIRNVTPEYLEEMIALRRADRVGSGAKETSWRWELFKKRLIEVQKQPFAVKDLKIDGHDVMGVLRIKPGRKVGDVLAAIFAEVEKEPKLNEREVLLEKLRKMI